MQINELTAVILAGGFGTRLRSAVPDRPKALAQIRGRPFLSFLLAQIERAAITKAVLCTGFRADQIEQAFGTEFGRLKLTYSREDKPLGTAGAIRLALSSIASDWIIVFNGDSFAEADLKAFCEWHSRKKAHASMVLAEVPDTGRFGRVDRNPADEIIGFAEKHQTNAPGWINAGIYLLHRTTIEQIPAGQAVSIEREVFPRLIGGGLFGFPGCKRFLDIGTPESYVAAEAFFAAFE